MGVSADIKGGNIGWEQAGQDPGTRRRIAVESRQDKNHLQPYLEEQG